MSFSKEGFLWTPVSAKDGLRTDAVIQGSPNIKQSYDVIVIGAGFAGLIAARDLSQKHRLKVLVVEARDRIGGRTWTAQVLGEEIEMGGTWVHWGQPHLYAELQRYGLHRNLKTSAGTYSPEKQFFKQAGRPVEEISLDKAGEALERVAQMFFTVDGTASRELMPYPHDPLREPAPWKKYDHWTVRDRLDHLEDLPVWEKRLFESNISTFGSAPGKDIGFTEALRWFALGGHSMKGVFELAGTYKLGNGGMTSLARAILNEFLGDILLNTAIKEVHQSFSGIEVVTAKGHRLKAKTVISTIPLNCLGDIKFNPPLSPLRESAVARGHMNKGAKVHFKLKSTEAGWFGTTDPSGDSSYVFGFSDHNGTNSACQSGTWCIGFGYNGHLTDKNNYKHIIKNFQNDLRFGADIEAYATHDWVNDPYAKGTWACWGPSCASIYLEELQRAHGRVLFASADWANGWRGFMDGAIERGQCAVQEAVKILKEEYGLAQAHL